MTEDELSKKVTRREFLTGAAVGAAGLAASGTLAGCGGSAAPEEVEPAPSGQESTAPQQWEWETPPAPIAQGDIKETVTTDVVVLGAGVAGLVAALTTGEAGLSTVLLEKGATYVGHGGWNGVIGSRLQKELGLEMDKQEVISKMMDVSAYRVDQRLVKLWADKSGEVMDWMLDMADAAGIEVIIESDVPKTGKLAQYPTAHCFMPAMQMTLGAMLEGNSLEQGVEINYETPAVRILREEGGRVTGVIAQTPEGDYKQFNANKGVILCTGGYSCSPEMLKAYIGFRGEQILTSLYTPALATGDGIKMGLWIGAAMDEPPHCPMLFDIGNVDQKEALPGIVKLVRQPFLNVNVLGERFVNEDQWYGYTSNADQLQPGGMKWVVWDDKWEDEVGRFGGTVCERMIDTPGAPPVKVLGDQWALVDMALEQGVIKKADSIDELAQIMEVPAETFKATVARYTELARNGKDEDFGKDPAKLTTIEQAPFYACKTAPSILVTLSGLKINYRMQVLDIDRRVIPGFYAAGNVSGGFFANDYPIAAIGVSHGRALTFGRLAAQDIIGGGS
jgi:fumarate reductase flavoprotein subunit